MLMLTYNMRLALKSFRRTPGLTALMVGAIALGIAACVMTMTVYHAMSGNPIWWKNDRLYAVTMDNWDPNRPIRSRTSDAAATATDVQGCHAPRRVQHPTAPCHHAQGTRRCHRWQWTAPQP